MKKSSLALIIVGSVLGFIILLGILFGLSYAKRHNKIIAMEESISGQWANVETAYQRRLDLIPNLVNTVKGYADFEKETLTQVIEARSKATAINIDPTKLDAAAISQFQQSQAGLSSALSKLMVVVEKYPDLKANQNFLELQAQLEGTENRISVERRKFNESVKIYNTYIRSFPQNILFGGKTQKGYFEADEAASVAPEVNF
jgi:LemA protein